MKLVVTKSFDDMSRKAADMIIEKIKKNPSIVLGLATGSSPLEIYDLLVEANLDWSKVTTFNLDEYIGVEPTHESSYRYFMNQHLFNRTNIDINNTFFPFNKGNITKNGLDYEKNITSKGGIDLQLLGIGENGHIAFNEPGTKRDKPTSEIQLTKSTIKANSRFFHSEDEVPKTAISMGIFEILKAQKILLVASGIKKANAIKALFDGPATEQVPASFLHDHKNVTVIIDEEAASLLNKKSGEYY